MAWNETLEAHLRSLLRTYHLETPSPFTLHGIKGMGEGAAIGPGALIASAVDDAIRPLTPARVTSLPITPEKVRTLIEQGRASG